MFIHDLKAHIHDRGWFRKAFIPLGHARTALFGVELQAERLISNTCGAPLSSDEMIRSSETEDCDIYFFVMTAASSMKWLQQITKLGLIKSITVDDYLLAAPSVKIVRDAFEHAEEYIFGEGRRMDTFFTPAGEHALSVSGGMQIDTWIGGRINVADLTAKSKNTLREIDSALDYYDMQYRKLFPKPGPVVNDIGIKNFKHPT